MAVCLTPQLSDFLKYDRRLFNDAYSPVEFTQVIANKHYDRAVKEGGLDRTCSPHGGANKCLQNLDRTTWKEEATWDILVYV